MTNHVYNKPVFFFKISMDPITKILQLLCYLLVQSQPNLTTSTAAMMKTIQQLYYSVKIHIEEGTD